MAKTFDLQENKQIQIKPGQQTAQIEQAKAEKRNARSLANQNEKNKTYNYAISNAQKTLDNWKVKNYSVYDVVEYNKDNQPQFVDFDAKIKEIDRQIYALQNKAIQNPYRQSTYQLTSDDQKQISDLKLARQELNDKKDYQDKYAATVNFNLLTDKTRKEYNRDDAISYANMISSRDDNIFQKVGKGLNAAAFDIAGSILSFYDAFKDLSSEKAGDMAIEKATTDFSNGKISQEQLNNIIEKGKEYKAYDVLNQDNLSVKLRQYAKELNEQIYYGSKNQLIDQALISAVDFSSRLLIDWITGGSSTIYSFMAQSYAGTLENVLSKVDEEGNKKYTLDQANANAIAHAAISGFTEMAGVDRFTEVITGGASKQALKKIIQNAIAEGNEEILEDILDKGIDYAQLGEKPEFKPSDMLESFLVASMSSAITTGAGEVVYNVKTSVQASQMRNAIKEMENLKKYATSDEELTLINNEIRKGQLALNNFEENSSNAIKPVDINTTNDEDTETVVKEALRPDVDGLLDYYVKLNKATTSIDNLANNYLALKGINMDSDQYINLDVNEKNTVMQLQEQANELGANVSFNTELRDNLGNIVDGVINQKTNETIINPKGKRSAVSTLIHELLHSVKNTMPYSTLLKQTKEYYGDRYNDVFNQVKEAYSDIQDVDVEEELVAITMQDLFGNEEYLNKLVKYNNSFAYRLLEGFKAMSKGDTTPLIDQMAYSLEDAITNNQVRLDRERQALAASKGIDLNNINDHINSSMSMKQAKRMIDLAFAQNDIKNWYDNKYSNADEWLNGEGVDEVATYVENTESTVERYLNNIKDEAFSDGLYYVSDIIDAYQKGLLVGDVIGKPQRLDLSKDSSNIDNRFYAPKDINELKKVYDVANQKATNQNKSEVYKARADLVLASHNKGVAENIGIEQTELNKKLRNWSRYSAKAQELSTRMNDNVALNNQWLGLENCSLINKNNISNEQMESLVKGIKGDSSNWQRTYITNTMLALDTHIDYKNLSFEFESNIDALGEYVDEESKIYIRQSSQNTVAHEIGHYIDYLWGKELGFDNELTQMSQLYNEDVFKFTNEQKQFIDNFKSFLNNLQSVNDIRNDYTNRDSEIFARFVAKFVEWTNSISTGYDMGESSYYDDNFTQSQFIEFIKLLQEKSSLNLPEISLQAQDNLKFSKGTKLDETINDSNKIEEYTKELKEYADTDVLNDPQVKKDKRTFRKYLRDVLGVNLNRNVKAFRENLDAAVLEAHYNGKISDSTRKVLKDIISENAMVENDMGFNINEINKYLKNNPIKLDESIEKDLPSGKGELSAFVKKSVIPIKRNEGKSWDIIAGEMAELYPGLIDYDLTSGTDFVNELNDALDTLKDNRMRSQAIDMMMSENEYDSWLDKKTNSILDGLQDMITTESQKQINEFNDKTDNDIILYDDGTVEGNLEDIYKQADDFEYNKLKDSDIAKLNTDFKKDKTFAQKQNRKLFDEIVYKIKQYAINGGEEVSRIAKDDNNPQLEADYDMLKRASSITQNLLANGRYDNQGKKYGKSFKEIWKPIQDSGKSLDFQRYMYNLLNVDTMKQGKPVFDETITSEISSRTASLLEGENPEFVNWRDDIYEFLRLNREYMVQHGLISKQTSDKWATMYPHYIPISRVVNEEIDLNSDNDTVTSNKGALKKRVGGEGGLQPLDYAIASKTESIVKSALFNDFASEYFNKHVDENDIMDFPELKAEIDKNIESVQRDETSKQSIMIMYDDGNPKAVIIDPKLYDSLNNKPSVLDYKIPVISQLTGLRTNLITGYNPVFWLTNGIKDIQDVFANSKHLKDFATLYPQAWKDVLTNADTFKLYKSLGGQGNSYFAQEGKQFKGENLLQKGANKILALNELIETMPRYTEFLASLKNGESLEVAMLNSAEITTNFKRGGKFTKFLNRNGFNFLNASVQGADKIVRNWKDAYDTKGMKGVLKYGAKLGLAYGVPLIILNSLLWRKDKDYEELSDYIKENYYIIGKYGDGKFIRIPKGRLANSYQSIMANTIDSGKAITEGEWDRVLDNLIKTGKNVIDNVAPNNPIENNIASPIFDVLTNKNWYGEELLPQRLKNEIPSEQYDETTSNIATGFSKFVKDNLGKEISPYKINYLLDQYTGGAGDIILPMTTPKAESGLDDGTLKGKLESALLSAGLDKFTTDSIIKNQNVSDFYTVKEELYQASQASSATDETILASKYMNSVNSQISKLYAEKRQVQLDTKLNDKDKYNKTRDIQDLINNLARAALDGYDDIDMSMNYASVNGIEYYKSNGEFVKVNDKDKDITKDYTTEQKGIYFNAKENMKSVKTKKEKTDIISDTDLTYEMKNDIYSSISNTKFDKVIDDNPDLTEEEKYKLKTEKSTKSQDNKDLYKDMGVYDNMISYMKAKNLQPKDIGLSKSTVEDKQTVKKTNAVSQKDFEKYLKKLVKANASLLGTNGALASILKKSKHNSSTSSFKTVAENIKKIKNSIPKAKSI